nr:molybdenum cofactor guanylyltransferase MobA [Rhodoferax sp.]
MPNTLAANHIGAVILAGGRGMRMGGVDKGLQLFRGRPMVAHALERLRSQTLGCPALIGINANRHLDLHTQHHANVWPDALEGFAGPLAGFLTALEHCQQQPGIDYLLTVPCDSPLFPLDLLERMAEALVSANADIAMASASEADDDGTVRTRSQPVFCLMRTQLLPSLRAFTASGGRKIDTWTRQHLQVYVSFDLPHDDPRAFFNANTLDQLQQLERE